MINRAAEPLELLVKTMDGVEKNVTLQPEDYYLNDKGKPVIHHDSLQNMADEIGGISTKIKSKLIFGVFHSFKSFCFTFQATAEIGESTYEEIGEANPGNLATNPNNIARLTLGMSYPAIMADKRAKDRLLIRLLGLKGQVYSDAEILVDEFASYSQREQAASAGAGEHAAPYSAYTESAEEPGVGEAASDNTGSVIPAESSSGSEAGMGEGQTTSRQGGSRQSGPSQRRQAPASSAVTNVDPASNPAVQSAPVSSAVTNADPDAVDDVEQMKALPVTFGSYKNNPSTLGNCLENDLKTVKWVAGMTEDGKPGFAPKTNSSKQMKDLHEAAKKLLALQQTA